MEISYKEITNVHRLSLKVSLMLVKVMKFHKKNCRVGVAFTPADRQDEA